MLVAFNLYKTREVCFHLIGRTIGFHVKTEDERFTTAGSRSCQDLKFENSTCFHDLRCLA